ncbi:hypothetical protein HY29_08290 [Hyphomonas beringensis]|uniref:Uncharacterized protein n=1 Tax=Hyphomonas beringensis TaxID=1280946 RepID=A0A062UKB3_9PROT|nr:hypothetical protein HY29_08290 [Hyphomonas beringensis]
MAYGAIEQVSDRRQADMRVRVYIKALARGIIHGSKMVEKDERPDGALRMEGQNTSHPEAAAQIPATGFNYACDG